MGENARVPRARKVSHMARYQPFKPDDWLHTSIKTNIGMLQLHWENMGTLGEGAVRRDGKKAQVVGGDFDGQRSAVKVFKPKFAGEHNVLITAQLMRFADVPGLRVCRRRVIGDMFGLLTELSGLAYAIVMPWIDGSPWAAYVEDETSLTRAQSLAVARAAADVLAGLERRKLVHADISSTNVFVARLKPVPDIQLIDVEDMYHPDFVDIPFPPDGSPGYQHPRNVGKSYWNPFGDRFAASVLLAEMLAWHDPAVRARKADVSLFAQEEMCRSGGKFDLVRGAVAAQSIVAAQLFEQAWRSSDLKGCPPLAQWKGALDSATGGVTAFPSFDVRMPEFTPRLAALLATHQTKLVDSTECVFCKQSIRNGNPDDHAPACVHHPSKFLSFLQTRKPTVAKQEGLEDILARYSNAAKKVPPKFDDIAFRPLAGPSQPQPQPQPAPRFPQHGLLRFGEIRGSQPTICPKCHNVITSPGGKEKGHRVTCTEWWKNM